MSGSGTGRTAVVTDDLVLYQYPGAPGLSSLSPPCMKVQLALRVLDLPFFVIDLKSPLAVTRMSPTGRVPVLAIGKRLVPDSVAILDALEAAVGQRNPFPQVPVERAADRLMEHYATDTLYWLGFHLRWLDPRAADRMMAAAMGEGATFQRTIARMFFIPSLRERARAQGVGGRSTEDVRAAFTRALDLLVTSLAGGPFLGGRPSPGRGDLAVTAHLAQFGFANATPDAMDAIRERPALLDHARATLAACRTPAPPWV